MLNVNGPSVMIFRRCMLTVKPHRPLIKFRRGANPDHGTAGSSDDGVAYKQQNVRAVLEDYQLPHRYRRRPLDEAEIAAINSGGVY